MTSQPELRSLLEAAYTGQERLSRDEIRRKAIAAELPAEAMTKVDALPEGEYAEDEVLEALHLG